MDKVKPKSLISWLLFDLANTVYAFVIPGLYFSVWLVSEKGWTDQQLGFATSSAMIIVAILGPWVGRKSDGSEGKKRLLLLMTIFNELRMLIFTFSALTNFSSTKRNAGKENIKNNIATDLNIST